MARRRSDDERQRWILANWEKHPIAAVRTRPGAPESPCRATAEDLMYLDEWADTIVMEHSEAPVIRRNDTGGFILERHGAKTNTPRRNIYTALSTVMWELAAKSAAQGE